MVDSWDNIYKAMADPHRRRVVRTLCDGPRPAGKLAELLGLAPNALSFHLRWLRLAGLIEVRREGRRLWYQLNQARLDAWRGHVEQSFAPVGTAEPIDRPAKPKRSKPGRSVPASRSPRRPQVHPAKTQTSPPPRPEPEAMEVLPTELL